MPDPQPPKPTPLKRFALQRPPLAPPGTVRIDAAPPPPNFSPWQLWGQGLLEGVVDPIRGALWGATGPEDTLAAKGAETVMAGLPLVAGVKSLMAGRGLYSRVDEALKLLPKKGAHPNKIASILKSNASSEELAYRGVPEFLASKGNATVTPADLAAHLAAHPAPVPVVKTLGSEGLVGKDLKAWLGTRGIPATPQEWTATSDELTRIAQQWQRNGDKHQADRYFRLSEQATELAEGLDLGRGLGAAAPKYAQYQLPGGEGYRETLVTLPPELKKQGRYKVEIRSPTGEVIYHDPNVGGTDVERLRQTHEGKWGGRTVVAEEIATPVGQFTSGHFDEPNILVHTRANERTLPTGERGRFVEEVQSDWHQQGKKEGYAGGDIAAAQAELDRRGTALEAQLRALGEGDTPQHRALRGEIGDITDDYNRLHDVQQYGVPDAPFKETWPDLGLKQQVLETAADPEAQWIGFTSGQTQAARYDLSKQLSEVTAVKTQAGTYSLEAYDKQGGQVIQKFGIAEKDLPDLVGKELAQKIQAADLEQRGKVARFTGLDLQVGGEGMRHFYDQVLPKRLEKIVKPFGGTVERGAVSRGGAHLDLTYQGPGVPPVVPDAPEPAWFARLTPEMKARILKEGLPLLSLTAFLSQMGQPPTKETR